MILEYKFDYRSSSPIYERIFLNQLKEFNLKGNIVKNHFELKLYVEASTPDELKEFATSFSNALPHSIFLYGIEASMVEEMPIKPYKLIEDKRVPSPPCPKCLNEIQKSYNIFVSCDICGYHIEGKKRNFKEEILKTAKKIGDGKVVELNTFYGKYFVGIPSSICNSIEFDILAYDLATIERYAYVEEYELKALASFEKPSIRLKKRLKFNIDYRDIEVELIRFRLPDDAILYLLMQELHTLGVDTLFISKDRVDIDDRLLLTEIENELEPIEVVASPKHIIILKGNRGLSKIDKEIDIVNPQIDKFYSVTKEHNLLDRFENLAGVNLDKNFSNIIIQGKKFGLIEYLSFESSFNSIYEIFNQIKSTDRQGDRLLSNFEKKFPQHYNRIIKIKFDNSSFNIYRLWGLIATVLNFTDSTNPLEAVEILEENALCFLGKKGPRIDYRVINRNGKPYFNPLMTIRTAISFKLAGADKLGLSYGIIESFLEFITNELDDLKQTMNIEAVVVTGSLLGNRKIFSKISQEISKNHNIYFNNEIRVLD